MDEKEYLGLVWKVATDSVKNCRNGNQDIGALNECFIETHKRFYELGGSEKELNAYE